MKIKTFSVAIIIAIAIIAYFVVPWVMMALGTTLMPNPPKPEITHGEFPFRLVYEINGEQKVVQDTLVCDYDGIGMNEGQGKYRKWKERLASGKEILILLEVSNPVSLGSSTKAVKQEIYYSTGSVRYYMGDLEDYEGYAESFPNASLYEKYADGSSDDCRINADELYKKYHIKLISWDITKPIKNTFGTTKK